MTDRPSNFDEIVADGHSASTDGGFSVFAHASAARSRIDDWFEKRMSQPLWWRLYHWGAPLVVVIVAAILRLVNLGHPRSLVFDETFYVKDAWTLWNLGYEAEWSAKADTLFAAGNTDVYTTSASFVVHPPLGKLLIGLGMAIAGPENSWGWRISTAIVGILAVALIMLIARKLFQSTALALVAGSLFAIDGNAIVMSRVALLDNFVMFFVLLGFGAIVLDREWSIRRLTQKIARKESVLGPVLVWRPWLIAAAIALGLASAVKWNGLYYLAFFAVYTLVVDTLVRRSAGVPFWASGTLLKQAPVSFFLTVPIAIAAYLSTWVSWFSTQGGYYRQWATEPSRAWTGPLEWVPLAVQSFIHFEQSVYNYPVGETRPHGYQANPLTWLLMIRPTSMFYEGTELGQNGCEVASCGASITGLANPLIWWAATAACLFLVYRFARKREWNVGLILLGLAAGYLPWLLYTERTVFQFYTIAFEPFMILGLTFVIGLVLGSRDDPAELRNRGFVIVAVFAAIAVALSIFFWPLWTAAQLSYEFLAAHWWLPTWR